MSDAAVQLSPGDWPAPLAPASSEAAGKNALVHIPGSKSLTNRYLLLAALADSPSYLRAPLHSRDAALMIEALRQLSLELWQDMAKQLLNAAIHYCEQDQEKQDADYQFRFGVYQYDRKLTSSPT